MPSNDLPGLAEQLAYYKAGGGKPNPIDTFNKVFGTVTNAGDAYNHIIKEVLANKAANLKNQETQGNLTPYRDIVAPLSPANSTITSDMTNPVVTGEASGPLTPEQMNSQNKLKAVNNLYAQRESMGNTTLDQMKTQAEIEALQNKGKEPPISVKLLPIEAKNRAIAAGYTEDDMLPPKLFNAIKGFDASSAVPYTGAAAAVQQGSGPANAKIIGEPQQGVNPVADARNRQTILHALPSNMSPSTVPGAAAQVQLAVNQGKALIAKPGTQNELSLASAEAARAVIRAAPTLESLQGANFSNSMVSEFAGLAQKLTANPNGPDAPKLRKKVYDLLDDLSKSSAPFIKNQMSQVRSLYGDKLPADYDEMENREMGKLLPNIPYQETSTAGMTATNPKTGQKIQSMDGGKTWSPAQ